MRVNGYELPLRVTPGVREDQYLCPMCRHEEDRFQLRQDIHGIKRRVDVSGSLCRRCWESIDEAGAYDD